MSQCTSTVLVDNAKKARKQFLKMDRTVSWWQLLFITPVMASILLLPVLDKHPVAYIISLVYAACATPFVLISNVWYLARMMKSHTLSIGAVACLSSALGHSPTDEEIEAGIEALRWTPRMRDRAILSERLLPFLTDLSNSKTVSLGEDALGSLRNVLKYARRPPKEGYPSLSFVEASLQVLSAAQDTDAIAAIDGLAVESKDASLRECALTCAAHLRRVLASRLAPNVLVRPSSESSISREELLYPTNGPHEVDQSLVS